jgi:phosphatidylserine decarboxylase
MKPCRAKYQPYDALRQQFWRQYLKQYDTDDTGTMSHIELTSMLDSLGSTLSAETISSFFTRNGKKPQEDELTFSETIQCLETEVGRPTNEKKRIYPDDNLLDYNSTPPTPNVSRSLAFQQAPPQLGGLDFSGPPMHVHDAESSPVEDSGQRLAPPPAYPTEFGQQLLAEAAVGAGVVKMVPPSYPGAIARESSAGSSDAEDSSGSGSGSGTEETLERVINVKNCPLCHRPRLNKKAEMDIITHLAVCASGDWAKIDRIVVGNFVTASQAQRKWYTKVISKVSSGDYRLGAVCVSARSFRFSNSQFSNLLID